MVSYFRIYLLFLIPSYVALSLGFFNSYKQQTLRIKKDFKEKYQSTVERYTTRMAELDHSYERIMRTALFGISNEIESSAVSPTKLKAIAKKYNVSHLFIINKDGRFLKSTNEDPSKIPNLYSFSKEYKRLISRSDSYLTTPVILPFPEKEPHKFLTIWTNGYFIEVGFKIKEIARTLEGILKQDENVRRVNLKVGESVYTIGGSTIAPKDTLKIKKSIQIKNKFFAQSESDGSHTYKMEFVISKNELRKDLSAIRKTYGLNFFLTMTLITLLLYMATKLLRKRVKVITSQITRLVDEKDFNKSLPSLSSNKDLGNLIKAINNLLSSYRESSEKAIQYEKDLAYKNMAFQVAHDIRSPLEALKASKEELAILPQEDKRNILMAISRIEEIAYKLLVMRKRSSLSNTAHPHVMSTLAQIVQEKKMQYRNHQNFSIKLSSDKGSFSSFAAMEADTFKRIISNLLANAAEAVSYEGEIELKLQTDFQMITLKIIDSGPELTSEHLVRIFEKGFTTKSEGNGLGLYHAKKEVEAANGTISFNQKEKTVVKLSLPFGEVPSTFASKIDLTNIKRVVILDDDASMHQVWRKRFKNINIELEHFYTAANLMSVYKEMPEDCFFLSDYELLGEEITGIDCISRLHAVRNSILVTARGDEPQIIKACEKHGIKLLPKTMANEIEIKYLSSLKKVILIDDDKLTHFSWKLAAKKAEVELQTYFSVQDFIESSETLEKHTPIYIDSDLGEGLKGEVLSEEIFNLGFTQLFMATGYSANDFKKPFWIKSILGKNPPF